jgi:hypothetical protein
MSTEQQQTQSQDDRPRTEKPEVKEEHKEQAKEMAKAYDEQRPTSTLPGSGGTVSGTAVTDWVDEQDKGKVDFSGQEEAKEEAEREGKKQVQERREDPEYR